MKKGFIRRVKKDSLDDSKSSNIPKPSDSSFDDSDVPTKK